MGYDMTSKIKFALITSSDSGAQGLRADIGGDAVADAMRAKGHSLLERKILPDAQQLIADQLLLWCGRGDIDLILTTGGTGLGPRDVMPEAMNDVLEYEVPGIADAMRIASLSYTPMAMISRGKSGVRDRTLILNLPGSPKGAVEMLEAVVDVLPHAVEILQGKHRGKHPTDD